MAAVASKIHPPVCKQSKGAFHIIDLSLIFQKANQRETKKHKHKETKLVD